jgi:glucose-6-phosphate 1-epimerase
MYSEIRIEGLETLDYLDNLCNKKRFTDQGNALTFESEVIYLFMITTFTYIFNASSFIA